MKNIFILYVLLIYVWDQHFNQHENYSHIQGTAQTHVLILKHPENC